MAATSAYARAAAAAARGILLSPRPPPPLLAFHSRSPSRGASISLPPGIRRASAAEGRVGKEEQEEEGPAWVELEAIGGEQQLDRALADAQQHDLPVVLFWTASWCRKCIFLKPKLEKLAAEYYPRIRFYCIDVNSVPQKLVNRAGVTKMPAIQMWSDSRKQAEVIGGHKSWLVIDDVRRMIEQEE